MARFVLTAQLQLQAPNNVGQIVSQIQNQLNGINVNVQVQGSARAQQQIQQITQSTNQATSAADRMGRAFAVSIRRFAAFSIATRAVGLFTSTLSNAIQTSIDFERQLIKVAQVTGKNVSDLRDLTNEITNLSTGLGVSSQSLLDVTTILTQAGLTANDTKIALNSLAKAALAPNFDSITQTAEGAIAILAQFKLGVGALESQLGSINAVAGAFAVEASDLIDVIRRTGGVFKSSGGDLNELLALFTSVRATTRESAESIGTGLRTIFTRIQRPETIEFLKQFGVELVDLEGKFVGPYEAIRRLSGALSGLGERDLSFIKIAEELGGFRQIGKVLPLLQQFSTAEAALNVATNANNSLTQDAISAQAALAVRIMKVREEFLALVRGITETPTFQIMANTALTLASALIKVADSIKPLLPLLTAVAAFRAVRGVGSFVGSAVAGLRSGRTFNQGGKVHHFATGGLVPGVGNSDTVPAMLSPGEFVIRKSSVQSLGASNLAGMNKGGSVEKYAAGGIVNENRHGYGIFTANSAAMKQAKRSVTPTAWKSMSEDKQQEMAASMAAAKTGERKKGQELKKAKYEFGLVGLFGNSFDSIKKTPETGTAVKMIGRTFSERRSKLYNSIMEKDFSNTVSKIGGRLAKSIGTTPVNDPNEIKNILVKSGIYNSIGAALEASLAIAGSPYDNKPDTNYPIDFRAGLGPIASKFKGMPPNIPTDATRTIGTGGKNQSKFLQQIDRYLIRNDLAKAKAKARTPVKKAAGGIGSGTDTVPALLTPGEFVVNKASAQRIGYSSLGRMNRVGKYANGGVVQRFATGGVANPFAGMSGTMGGQAQQAQGPQNNSSNRSSVQVTQQATQATMQFGMGISLVTASLQAMLPPIDDSSSSAAKFGNTLLTMGTTIGGVVFALESFGVSLTKANVMNFLGGGGVRGAGQAVRRGVSGLARGVDSFASTSAGQAVNRVATGTALKFQSYGMPTFAKAAAGFSPSAISDSLLGLSNPLGKLTFGFTKLLGPLTLATVGISVLNAVISAFSDAEIKKKKAIESGDVAGAGREASRQYDLESANTGRMALGVTGAAVGLLLTPVLGPLGPILGASLGTLIASAAPGLSENISLLFGGNTRASVVALAQAQAQATKTQKAFEQGEKDATKAMEEFNRGAISAAEALSRTDNVSKEAQNLQDANNKAITSNTENQSTGTLSYLTRGLASAVSFGYVESQATRNSRLDKENSGMNKETLDAQRKQFDMRAPARNEAIRASLLRGDSREQLNASLGNQSPEALRAKAQSLAMSAGKADMSGKNDDAKLFREQARLAADQAEELEKSIANLDKEITASKEKFAALNLGFRSVTANSDAAALRMSNLSKSFEVGAFPVEQATATLEAALTSAGQNINKVDFGNALKEVNETLTAFGAAPEQIKKFSNTIEGVAGVQRNFPAIFDQMKAKIAAGGFRGKDMTADAAGKEFKNIVAEQLKNSGIDEGAREQIMKAMGDIKLSEQDLSQIGAGDYSVLEKYLGDAGAEVSKVMKGMVDNYVKVNQELINVSKQRIEAERNYIDAQKEALSLQMEGRELQGKYGGKAVTNEERRQNILARANASGVGPNMKTGSLAEIRARNNAMSLEFGVTEQQRRTKNGMAGVKGVQADERQKDIQKAQKDQVNTIRELVKLEEENLKLIGEKNKLEKDSIDALVTGDIDKFMESQATVGATAAIATGNKTLMNAFGANALGSAAQDIRRQQDAGVQSIYGRQLGGQGGLTQQAYGAALGARGITDPRMAQVATGNTAEEEAAKSRLRDYGTALDETGALGSQMAEMQVETAEMRVQQAQIIVDNLKTGGAPAVGKANGGLIYASRGMFIPRGTDTVPAMLTPGEFVVRREAVNRGNNLQLLKQMNGAGGGMTNSSEVMGFARGGRVQYYSAGSSSPVQQQSSSSSIDGDKFINQLSKQLDRLENAVVQHSVGNSTVRVDIMGGGMLQQIAGNIENNVRSSISKEFSGAHATENGLKNNGSVLGSS